VKIDERTGSMEITAFAVEGETPTSGLAQVEVKIPLIGPEADNFLERFINLRRQQREVNFRMDMAQFERVNGRAITNRDTQEKN
jgi:hypothetical protein